MDRGALVTGGIGNIGGAVTKRLAADGFKLFVVDVAADRIDEMVAELTAAGHEAAGMTANLRDTAEAAGAVAAAHKAFGRIDALVHTVGHSGATRSQYIEDIGMDVWDDLIALNLMTTVNVCRSVLPIMRAQKYGRLVNLGTAGWMGSTRPTSGCRMPYFAMKAAVYSMTRQIAKDHAEHGVTANLVSPSVVLGEKGTRIRQAFEKNMTPEQIEAFTQSLPMRRICSPEEIAAAVAFLVSEGASYVSAQNIQVDGASN